MEDNQLEYTGELKYQPNPKDIELIGEKRYPYLPNPDLIKAVNLAIYLQRPLLLQGEPGCGKTLLARAIADEFSHRQKIENYPYFPWYIKSTSRAKEGLYTYDAVGRLRDAQLVGTNYEKYLTEAEINELFQRLKNSHDYIKWGALGKAFRTEKYRPIILIDEIDKADIDFPNDLLLELDEKKFTITETGKTITTKQPPIVIITSNSEKELPDAFLRRCIFHYLEFPQTEELIEIVKAHFPDSIEITLIEAAINEFIQLRDAATSRKNSKKASTSELLDWIRWLNRYPTPEALKIIQNLANNSSLLGALIKTKPDKDYYIKQKSKPK
ncbi:MAG TPA: MoxR family ATPase [Cyanobacteria bacterium UBA11149]|nr:MoxR family ATPase [Cyanobacteria bacterium UBA11367]HBE56300.1 MoxR family ATPase [Cyanobacteria bacterium UBA11366]HBK65542.1 MoxR family ATPase [Cyanobacteria bacterium UBA11166]HBR74995.1 MoxR family ATPase [Cyanobacteria bacterium UBA11159]HBS70823.1 MoxR family ATPase [Cyanobacteria bacterium UBA11153]HBW89555.1 MoxR family ATPase [Cyanobacteria bacterium UBA11149]HCA94008.1 MoxR family ATPase [Cyanobacteria bacterium UBA9226]